MWPENKGVYLGMALGKCNKREMHTMTHLSHFRRINLSLVGCSPAEPTSFSIEHSKKLNNLLYLQSVKKSNHVQNQRK